MATENGKHKPTVGILYPGDMGSSLGRGLQEDGFRVVTTAEGRSQRTHRLAQGAGLTILAGFRQVVEAADIVLSIVPPAAAVSVAETYHRLAVLAPRGALFIDANPVRPSTALEIAELFANTHVSFLDGAIHGVASHVRSLVTLYLSGAPAASVASLFSGSLRVKALGDKPGNASAFKMMLGGMSKGLVALFLEMGRLASTSGLALELHDCYRHFYPGIMDAIDRILPTYPRHAARRADEMRELEETMKTFELEPCMVAGARQVLRSLAEVSWPEEPATGNGNHWTVQDVVEELHRHHTLLK